MAEIHLIKTNGGIFIPAFDSDKEIANQIRPGDVIKIKYTKPRNYRFLKKFMAMIKCGFDNQETYTSFEDFRHDLIRTAKSISFAKMDEIKFNKVYSDVLDVLIRLIFKDADKREIENQILTFM
jgi:hypothetical protein